MHSTQIARGYIKEGILQRYEERLVLAGTVLSCKFIQKIHFLSGINSNIYLFTTISNSIFQIQIQLS